MENGAARAGWAAIEAAMAVAFVIHREV